MSDLDACSALAPRPWRRNVVRLPVGDRPSVGLERTMWACPVRSGRSGLTVQLGYRAALAFGACCLIWGFAATAEAQTRPAIYAAAHRAPTAVVAAVASRVRPEWLAFDRPGASAVGGSTSSVAEAARQSLEFTLNDASRGGSLSDTIRVSVRPIFVRRGAKIRWTIRF